VLIKQNAIRVNFQTMRNIIAFNWDSLDGSRTGFDILYFSAFPQNRSEVLTATVTSGSTNGGRVADIRPLLG
jgi:hypothetical protein